MATPDAWIDELLKKSVLKASPKFGIESTSFYAARHAVLAVEVGIKVDRVCISSNDTGICELQPLPGVLASQQIINLLAMYMAGAHGCFPSTCCTSVLKVIGQATAGRPLDVELVRDAFERREELLALCEGQIQAVADALLSAHAHTLSGEEVTRIVRGVKRSIRG